MSSQSFKSYLVLFHKQEADGAFVPNTLYFCQTLCGALKKWMRKAQTLSLGQPQPTRTRKATQNKEGGETWGTWRMLKIRLRVDSIAVTGKNTMWPGTGDIKHWPGSCIAEPWNTCWGEQDMWLWGGWETLFIAQRDKSKKNVDRSPWILQGWGLPIVMQNIKR